jgi:hypothetical protein
VVCLASTVCLALLQATRELLRLKVFHDSAQTISRNAGPPVAWVVYAFECVRVEMIDQGLSSPSGGRPGWNIGPTLESSKRSTLPDPAVTSWKGRVDIS